MKRLSYLIILLVANFMASQAQELDIEKLPKQFFFRNISTSDGLSHITVNSILRDTRGFIWIGTEDGLNRYDGTTFRIFRNNPRDSNSISHNLVYSLLEEKTTGNIWIGTVNGLCYYDRHKEKLTSIRYTNSPDRNAYIRMKYDERRNRIWLACEEGGLRFLDLADHKIHDFDHPQFSHESVLSLELLDDVLYVGTTSHGMKALDLQRGTVDTYDTQSSRRPLTNNVVKALLITPEYLWIGTDGGVNRMSLKDHSMSSFTREKNSISGNRIRSLARDQSGNIWVGTDGGGLSIITKDATRHFEYKHSEYDERSVCDNTIRSIYIEPQGDAWLGTYGGGISYHSANSNDFYLFKKEFGTDYSMSDNNVNAMSRSDNHTIWIATQNGLDYIKDGQLREFPLAAYFGDDPQVITSVCADAGGTWVGTYQYGAIYISRTGAITQFRLDENNPQTISNNTVWNITEDKQGLVWFSTESGVNIYNPKSKTFLNYRNKPDNEFGKIFRGTQNQAILLSRKKQVWIGTYGYLAMYDSASDKTTLFTAITDSSRVINNPPVSCIQENDDDKILIGTFGNGMCVYNPVTGHFKIIDETDGLPNNNVMSIEIDAFHDYWLGTNEGIVKYDPRNHSFITYDEGYGLQGLVFNPRASLKMPDGVLMFAGVEGLNAFKPKELIRDSSDLKIAITDFQILNKSIQPDGGILSKSISETEMIELPYDNSRLISFRFSCLNYFSNKVRYEYQLSGFNNNWEPLMGAAPLTFTNLDPGSYQVKLRAYINPKIKGPEKIIGITILAPWYKTRLARIAGLLLLGGSFFAFMRFRTHSLNKRKIELERLVAEQSWEILGQNEKLRTQNESLISQNEEIQSQSEELTEANQILTELNREVLEQKEEIQTQSEELTESYVAISQINQTLEEKIESRTSELRKAFQELDTFFYRSSHDFRRPLTTFMGLAQIAKITVKDLSAIDLFEKVDETARHLDRMVKKLQSVSDVGSHELTQEQVSMQQLVDQTLMAFRTDLEKRDISVTIDIAWKEKITTYPLLIKIIIENLFENAIQFHGPVDPFIKLRILPSEAGILLEVNDNGRGIDGIYHSRIFEMYFRASEVSKGNGLGLFIIKKASERLGGRISFKSEKNVGSTFSFWFRP